MVHFEVAGGGNSLHMQPTYKNTQN